MAEKRPSLNVLSGPLAGQRFVLEDAVDNILIGSDDSCGFVLNTPGVSPIHARLWVDLNGATVYDTNSPTGVYVNDDRVVKEAPVRNGDILWLGPPGEEGSVLIQCILPPPDAPAPAEAAGEAAPGAGTAPVDTGATMAFGMPAYLPEEPAIEAAPPPADAELGEAEATVVMTSPDLMGNAARPAAEPEPEPEPTVSYAPADAAALLDMSDGLEVVDEPTVALPLPVPPSAPHVPEPPSPPAPVAAAPPAADMGFPDFDVEPTVAMPPPFPPRAAATVAPATSEFEEDMEPTVVDVPAPTVVTHTEGPAPPAPATPARPSAPAPIKEDDASTVMYRRPAAPVVTPPVPAPPAAPPAAAPTSRAAAAPARAKPEAPPRVSRPAAEARPSAPKAPPAARPAAPPPKARAERPAAPAAAAPAPVRRSGGGGKGPLIVGAAVVVVGLAAAAFWFLRPKPSPVTEASPAVPPPVAEATPPVIAEAPPATQPAAPPDTAPAAPVAAPSPIPEAVTVVRTPPPSPRIAAATPPPVAAGRPGAASPGQRPPTSALLAPPVATPNPAQQAAAAVANLMAQARTASEARNYDAAIAMYDEVLKLEPQNAAATTARNSALAARNASRKSFAAGRTAVQTEQKSKGGLAGFDSADVVQKNPDFLGRIEFAMNPPTVKPGEPYQLQIALVNDGKKSIKISGMTFTVTVNGNKTGNPIAPRVKEVAPSQRAVLEELPGVFPAAATSWMAEVLVTANKGDSLKNQLTWK